MDAFAPVIFTGALHLRNAPQPDVLRAALDDLQTRKALLRVALAEVNGDPWFSLHETPPKIPLAVVPRKDRDHWRRTLEGELGTPFNCGVPPLTRFVLLQGEPDSELVFSFHHSIIDSRSGEALLNDLLETCARLASGTALPGVRDSRVPRAIDDLFPASFRGLRKLRRLAGFLARQVALESRYRRTLGNRQLVHGLSDTRRRVLPIELSQQETHLLTRSARKHRLPITGVLHTAMLIALWRVKYAADSLPMRGISFGDLRPSLRPPPDPSRLGMYITMLQYTVDIGPNTELWPLARHVTDQIDAAAKSTDKFAATLLSKHLIRFLLRRRSMRMGMVALSYPGPLSIKRQCGEITVLSFSGAVANNPLGPELAGFGKIINARLSLDLQYLDSDLDEAQAEAVADHIRRLLKRSCASEGDAG